MNPAWTTLALGGLLWAQESMIIEIICGHRIMPGRMLGLVICLRAIWELCW